MRDKCQLMAIIVSLQHSGKTSVNFNTYVTNQLSHPYRLDEFIFIFCGIRSCIILSFIFDENGVSKRKSPRWDAAFCGVTSGAILFAYE